MLQETNADLKKEIEKRSILITILIIAILVLGAIELFINPPFFLGLLLGVVVTSAIKFGVGEDNNDPEW